MFLIILSRLGIFVTFPGINNYYPSHFIDSSIDSDTLDGKIYLGEP